MNDLFNLKRFLRAQEDIYLQALGEIQNGKKLTHWMWFIFPQIIGLGHSDKSLFYGIKNSEEAKLYLEHPILGSRLIEITNALLELNEKRISDIFGRPDDLKLKSCMTLFSLIDKNENSSFKLVLKKYFFNDKDIRTLQLLSKINKPG